MPRSTPVLAAAALGLLAAPATASATPSLQPLKACYDAVDPSDAGREQVQITGAGFTPGAAVNVLVNGQVEVPNTPADASGNLSGTISAPYVESGEQPFTVTLTEAANPAQTITASSLVTKLRVSVKPKAARPSTKVRFRGAGFTADKPVYAHYVRKGKSRKTVRLVDRPSGACGKFSVRRAQFPFTPATGKWTVRFDQLKRYVAEPENVPYVRLGIEVVKRRAR